MLRHTSTATVLASTGVVGARALTGCSASGNAPVGVATRTVTAAPSSAAPATGTPTTGTSPSASTPATDGSSAAGSPAAGSGPDGSRCATASLAGSIEAGSGGAAGSTYVHLVLRNTGAGTCTLQGWPGVSFVGDGNGTQLGSAASEDRASAHPTVSLRSGQEAVAALRITNAEDYPAAECDPVSPDGLRVYPPGSEQSLFVPTTDHTACRSTAVTVLSVQALVPQGQAAD
jgi:hypothetical protein